MAKHPELHGCAFLAAPRADGSENVSLPFTPWLQGQDFLALYNSLIKPARVMRVKSLKTHDTKIESKLLTCRYPAAALLAAFST